MKSKRLFVAIGNIDDKFIDEDAEVTANQKDRSKKRTTTFSPWLKFATPLAACLIIAIGIFIGQNGLFMPPQGSDDSGLVVPPGSTSDNPSNNNGVVDQVAYGFAIGDRLYFPISFDDRKKFGLVPQGDVGATPHNFYAITENDLGELIGVVENSADESLVGAQVFHFSAYPNSYAICIVDKGERTPVSDNGSDIGWESSDRYEFYTFAYIMSLDGASSDAILNAYGMTKGTVYQVEVLASDWSPVANISDEANIFTLLDILHGHEDIGLTAHEEMMVSWLTAYDPNWRDNDNRFMELQQRSFRIANKDTGLELFFIYNPFIKSLCTHNSFYVLTEENAAIMNELLMVSQ